jgi:hypothetical protein
MSAKDKASIQGAGEKQIKQALKCALARLALVEAMSTKSELT